MHHGQQIRVSLTDGSTLVGTLRFSWGWWSLKLTDVSVATRAGEVPAPGFFVIPRRNVLHVQVVVG